MNHGTNGTRKRGKLFSPRHYLAFEIAKGIPRVLSSLPIGTFVVKTFVHGTIINYSTKTLSYNV